MIIAYESHQEMNCSNLENLCFLGLRALRAFLGAQNAWSSLVLKGFVLFSWGRDAVHVALKKSLPRWVLKMLQSHCFSRFRTLGRPEAQIQGLLEAIYFQDSLS